MDQHRLYLHNQHQICDLFLLLYIHIYFFIIKMEQQSDQSINNSINIHPYEELYIPSA